MSGVTSSNGSGGPYRFEVALSFPGEHREVVEAVARELAERHSEERVLYDRYHDAEFARPDLDIYLPGLYRNDSGLVVLFLCPEYANKRWCLLEWRHIRQFLATVEAEKIMFLSFGDPGDLSGLGILGGDGYVDVTSLSPEEITAKILRRQEVNAGGRQTPSPALPLLQGEGDPGHARAAWSGLVGPPVTPPEVDISRIGRYAPEELVGREAELEILNDAWRKVIGGEKGRPHVLTFVALGGEGKTSLVAKWLADLAAQDWPSCEAAFAWSFYSQGSQDQSAASSDLFLAEALKFFGDEAFGTSAAGAYEKAQRLARLVGEKRALLILDGLEPLQFSPSSPTPGELKDKAMVSLLKGLAARSQGLCVATTRYSLPELKAFRKTTAPEHKLDRLSTEAGVHLLKSLGVRNGTEAEFERLVNDVAGHALTLTLVGGFLKRAFNGDIRLRDRVDLIRADDTEQNGHAFRAMAAYENWLLSGGQEGEREVAILRTLGLFDRPADAECLMALRKASIPGLTEHIFGIDDIAWELSLSRLADAKLVTVNRNLSGTLLSLDAHPLLREYFAQQLRTQYPDSWQAGHRSIFDYLCRNTEHRPDTLEGLQPLYQAVAHGCLAGMRKEAREQIYRDRILRGADPSGFYSRDKLAAHASDLGAVACFFDYPWSRVSPTFSEQDQAWLLSEAASSLLALGRLPEARESMRTGLRMAVEQGNWRNAAIGASTLSQLEQTLGEISAAVTHGEQSVEHADRTGEAFHRMSKRATLAGALHQAGRQTEAETLFEEAEQMQAEWQPQNPRLFSVRGFRYCDLLLTSAEREAWKRLLHPGPATPSSAVDACHYVRERATETLPLAKQNRWLLDIALDQLSLGRAALYRAALQGSRPDAAETLVDRAVEHLRRAGRLDFLPLGLITCAWLRRLQGKLTGPESAQENLDEASGIAERGSMALFLADIHLHRARLFYNIDPYPWNQDEDGNPSTAKDDLREARRLIEKHGYWRRKEELEDAEAVIG